MSSVLLSADRSTLTYLRWCLRMGHKKLFLLSPRQSGQTKWVYAATFKDKLVVLGKPVSTRAKGLALAEKRFGVKVYEVKSKSPRERALS